MLDYTLILYRIVYVDAREGGQQTCCSRCASASSSAAVSGWGPGACRPWGAWPSHQPALLAVLSAATAGPPSSPFASSASYAYTTLLGFRV